MEPQGPCGDKPCPDQEDQMPPDAKQAKNKVDNIFENIKKGISDAVELVSSLWSSDNENSSDNDNEQFTNDALNIYGEGGDAQVGNGIVQGNDRGDGNTISVSGADINPLNTVLSKAIEAMESDSEVTSFDVDATDEAAIIQYSSNNSDDNVIWVRGSQNRESAASDSADIMNTTVKKEARGLTTYGTDSIIIITRKPRF